MSEERNYSLYKVTSPDSPKFYIGVTGKTVEKRLAAHLNDARHGKKKHRFYAWLRKRITTATITPMLVRLTKEVALELERITVDLCFEHESEFILNTAPGGGMPPSSKGKKLSDWHRARMSEVKTGQRHTDEAKAKISNANRGRKLSAETKAKMSTSRMGRARCKPVVGVDDDGSVFEFQSAVAADKWLGMRVGSVKDSINKGCRAGGYRWSYKK